jgi:hypothetical protein
MDNILEIDTDDIKDGDTVSISLTTDNSAWIELAHLPYELKTYSQVNFNMLFNLHPVERGKIIMGNGQETREIESSRWHASYLNTPKWDRTLETSYMFSGYANSQVTHKVESPSEFSPFYEYMNKLGKYNQVVANWYKDGSDFIPFHSDYSYGMPKDSDVAILSLYEHANDYRVFSIKAKQIENNTNVCYEKVDIKMRHGHILFMRGDTQDKFRHGVPQMETNSRRISLTMRYYD